MSPSWAHSHGFGRGSAAPVDEPQGGLKLLAVIKSAHFLQRLCIMDGLANWRMSPITIFHLQFDFFPLALFDGFAKDLWQHLLPQFINFFCGEYL